MKALSNHAVCPNCSGGHKSKPFCIYEDGYHCYSCGFHKSSDRSFKIQVIQYENPDYPELNECLLDVSQFSLINQKWLLKFHVTRELSRKFRIMQSEDGGLIYPNIEDGVLVGYQKRWVGGERRIITKGSKRPFFISKENSDTIVLVEDFISAIRCSRIVNSCCLWGTKLSFEATKRIVNEFKNIIIWLDNDCNKTVNSGQEAAQELYKTIERSIFYKNRKRFSHEQTVRNIATEKDPKAYVDSEIGGILCLKKSILKGVKND